METVDDFNGRVVARVELDTDTIVIHFTDGTRLKANAYGDGSPDGSGAVIVVGTKNGETR